MRSRVCPLLVLRLTVDGTNSLAVASALDKTVTAATTLFKSVLDGSEVKNPLQVCILIFCKYRIICRPVNYVTKIIIDKTLNALVRSELIYNKDLKLNKFSELLYTLLFLKLIYVIPIKIRGISIYF